ncbi:MAG: hypothetical protein NZ959_12480 [Armatimonadetes bacterium]|nr:hypothetical protein [Armatimonadota bacterium]MDW8122277.1 hypothetical protein [Armatimonadota bacterium]
MQKGAQGWRRPYTRNAQVWQCPSAKRATRVIPHPYPELRGYGGLDSGTGWVPPWYVPADFTGLLLSIGFNDQLVINLGCGLWGNPIRLALRPRNSSVAFLQLQCGGLPVRLVITESAPLPLGAHLVPASV